MKLSYRIIMTAAMVLLLCTAASAQVVINEIDYDQPGTDTAEFVELYNAGTATVDLSSYTLSFINGANGGAVEYNSVPLTGFSLAAGDFFVVCSNVSTTPNCDLVTSSSTNLIQNGAPDAVALYDGANIVDTVSYEGDVPGFVEGSGAIADGNNVSQSISRVPNGNDTDDNGTDFCLGIATPGEANDSVGDECGGPVPAKTSDWGTTKAMFR